MAYRDKSQGFGFVYVDLEKLLAQRDELIKNPLVHPQTESVQTVNLNRDTRRDVPKTERAPEAALPSGVTLAQIRENLDRIQALHHKLHAVLEELSTVTDREKKKRGL